MRLIYKVGILGAFVGMVGVASAQLKSERPSMECRFLPTIEQGFLTYHITQSQRTPELAGRLVDQYLKRIDPAKIYLTQADEKKVRDLMKDVFSKNAGKDCSFLPKVQALLLEKVKSRAEFVKKHLGKDFQVDPKTEFVYQPDKQPFPKSDADAENFLKKYLQFQVANYVATDMKLEEAKDRVIKNYERVVRRTMETSQDDLYAGYLDSFARALDPHSSFFSRDVLEDFNISMSLSLEGIGATLSSEDGFTVVEALVPGGAAAKSGQIEPQDKIVAVGQAKGAMENVIDQDLKDVVKKIRGPKGTKVRLSVLRKEGDRTRRFEVVLTRDKVNLEDEAASIIYMDREISGKKQKIGVINFPSFYSDTRRGGRSSAADVKRLVAEARKNGAAGLVLDMSNNGGGSLEDAVKIAGLFFKTGNVVKQSSKGEQGEQILADTDPAVDWAGPLVVLTSRISASASEIVAGTLQDYKRAVVVGGDHTFGKGSVQSVLPMPSNLGAIKVTVGMFFVPGGNSTQHRGVDADIVLPGPYSSDEIGEKSLDYSLPPKKITAFLSPSAYVTEGNEAWTPIKTEWLKPLKEKSQARVDANEDFKKILEDLKKAKERGKLIRVSEVISETKEAEKKEKKEKDRALRYGKKADRDKEYLKRAEVQEAANVLVDLIQISSGKDPGPQAKN